MSLSQVLTAASAPGADAGVPSPDLLGSLPLLASTQFCMEILLRGPVLDLASVMEVLRFDPCALLRLFAAVHEEGNFSEDRPERLEECIIALGSAGLIRALHHAPSTWQQQARLNSFAEHGAAIGTYARQLAAAAAICDETAFNAGLLHAIGTLPAELARCAWPGEPADECRLTEQIADRYQLPDPLRQALLSFHTSQPGELWPALLQAAHELAEAMQPVRAQP